VFSIHGFLRDSNGRQRCLGAKQRGLGFLADLAAEAHRVPDEFAPHLRREQKK